jgi:hypothetical protein
MSEHEIRSIWVRLSLYLIIVDLVVILGRMLLGWPPLTSFHLFFYGAQLALVPALIGLLQALFGVYKKQRCCNTY